MVLSAAVQERSGETHCCACICGPGAAQHSIIDITVSMAGRTSENLGTRTGFRTGVFARVVGLKLNGLGTSRLGRLYEFHDASIETRLISTPCS